MSDEQAAENTNTADDQATIQSSTEDDAPAYVPATFDFNTLAEAEAVAEQVKGSIEPRGVAFHVNLPE